MSEVETIAARDGTPLLVRRWAATGTPWATVLVIHGIGEHSGRHEATGGRFAAAGLEAVSFDHRGFGASGGRRAYVERWSEYLDDIEDRLAASRREGLPSAMYAHSLGGLLAADYLLDGRPLPDVAVLSAPALGAGVNPLLRAVAPVLSAIAPRFAIQNPWNPAAISREPMLPAVGRRDPLSAPMTTARLGNEVFRAMSRVRERLADQGRFPLPVLVVHGGDDTLVPTASTAFTARFPSVERRVYPGVRHEPHHDPFDGERIVQEMVEWLRAKLAPAGAGEASGPAEDEPAAPRAAVVGAAND
jgi:acylglycerol lipase